MRATLRSSQNDVQEDDDGEANTKRNSRVNENMRVAPPLRLPLTLPQTQPMAAITGTSSSIQSKIGWEPSTEHHEENFTVHTVMREPSGDAELPRFASNKIRPRCVALSTGANVCTGWIEPHPRHLRALGRSALPDFSSSLLKLIFDFCDSSVLDESVVLVCRLWHFVVCENGRLLRRRFAFVYEDRNENCGILWYLGRMRSGALKRRAQSTIECNPAEGPFPAVHLSASHLLHLPRMLTNFVSHGLSHFETESMPYAWVGIDFGEFRVRITHYTIGTSTVPHAAYPVEWELQGCTDAGLGLGGLRQKETNWNDSQWIVLDRRCGDFFASQKSVTFAVQTRFKAVVKRLRVVQLARNSQWGLELVVSGFEVFGDVVHPKAG